MKLVYIDIFTYNGASYIDQHFGLYNGPGEPGNFLVLNDQLYGVRFLDIPTGFIEILHQFYPTNSLYGDL